MTPRVATDETEGTASATSGRRLVLIAAVLWSLSGVVAKGLKPLDGVTIDVVPFMPDHGHGTSIDAVVTPADSGAGEYSISRVNLWMPGLWQVTLRTQAGGATDDVVLAFCITG